MSTEGRWSKSVVKTFLTSVRVSVANGTHTRLSACLVHNVYAVPSTMSSWDALRLAIEAEIKTGYVPELTHGVL